MTDTKLTSCRAVFIDYDGIFSKYSMFTLERQSGETTKNVKTYQFAARHSLELLQQQMPDLHIVYISGDQRGWPLTSEMLKGFPGSRELIANQSKYQFILDFAKEHNIPLNEIVFVGDDVHDLPIAALGCQYITHHKAINYLQQAATVILNSTPDYYLIAELCQVLAEANHLGLHTIAAKDFQRHVFTCNTVMLKSNLSQTTSYQLAEKQYQLKQFDHTQLKTGAIELYDDIELLLKDLHATCNGEHATFTCRLLLLDVNKFNFDRWAITLARLANVLQQQPLLAYQYAIVWMQLDRQAICETIPELSTKYQSSINQYTELEIFTRS